MEAHNDSVSAATGLTWREGQELCENLAEIKTEEQNRFLAILAMLEEDLVHTQSWQIGTRREKSVILRPSL